MTDPTALLDLLHALGGTRVLCVGDVILDHFHHGRIERISPEAPVPILLEERTSTMLGGAGNVVRNLAALGSRVKFLSVVGMDEAGADVRRLLDDHTTLTHVLLRDKERRTSTKTRYLADGQQVLRADRETVMPLATGMRKKLLAAVDTALKTCRVVVLSDYGKGVLADGVARDIITKARAAKIPVIVDPKGQDYGRYRGASLLTPNRRELAEATGTVAGTVAGTTGTAAGNDKDIDRAAKQVIRDHAIKAILVTRGRDGMTLFEAKEKSRRGGRVSHIAAEAREVFDVSGAGDTVVAAMAAAMAAGADLPLAAAMANAAAGIVVGKVGTAVAEVAEIAAAIRHQDLSGAEDKVVDLEPALRRIAAWRKNGLTVGFTNGCFDLLHPGHVALLAAARRGCDRLIVGLNSDASVARLKGPSRPVQAESARAVVLASLVSVDMVVVFAEDTPLALIVALRPDVLVKGADWALGNVVGAKQVKSWGGRIVRVALKPGHSTTATLARMAKK